LLSLNLRVFITATVILSSFFGIAGITLDKLYRNNTRQALEERLQGSIYQLIAVATLDKQGHLKMPEAVPDTRLNTPHSGLYAQLASNKSNWQWRSASMAGFRIDLNFRLPRTVRKSVKLIGPDTHTYMALSYGVAWGDTLDPAQAYTFTILHDLAAYNADIATFRGSLWGTLGGVAVLLLLVQGTILRWGLSPLKHAAEELSAIESGSQTRLKGDFPPELRSLTNNINALLSHQQEHLERSRKSLGDLAHSLKTPLAILRAAVENKTENHGLEKVVAEQVERMNQLTNYQLQRAATSGRTVLTAPIKVDQIVKKVLSGLHKVYAEKGVKITTEIMESAEFYGDEGDLMEIIGNLADNAFKWCTHTVSITVKNKVNSESKQKNLLIKVEDDGPGVPPELADFVMQRGNRASQDIAGHGIGLSIVRDIIQVYGGELEISESQMGGVKARTSLPLP
jgi:two-component system sensor histidine kinase PhoQ